MSMRRLWNAHIATMESLDGRSYVWQGCFHKPINQEDP